MRPPAPRTARMRRCPPCRARRSLYTLSKGAQAPLEPQRSPLQAHACKDEQRRMRAERGAGGRIAMSPER
jgi:hypothetical protein